MWPAESIIQSMRPAKFPTPDLQCTVMFNVLTRFHVACQALQNSKNKLVLIFQGKMNKQKKNEVKKTSAKKLFFYITRCT